MGLMDAVTRRPRCHDEEFIPLPSVVSFAPRDYEPRGQQEESQLLDLEERR